MSRIRHLIILTVTFIITTGTCFSGTETNFMPTPFPIMAIDRFMPGFHGNLEGGYSFVQSHTTDTGSSDLILRTVFSKNFNEGPSFHLVLDGSRISGTRTYSTDSSPITQDISGSKVTLSFTPSMVLGEITDHVSATGFLGIYGQIQRLDFSNNHSYSITLNSNDWTKPVYNPYIDQLTHKEVNLAGCHAGFQFPMMFKPCTISPYVMTQFATGTVKKDTDAGTEQKSTTQYIANSLGLRIVYYNQKINTTVMVQFVNESDTEDAISYTVQTGISF